MNINILCGKNTVEVLCMTEKAGLEKTVVFNLKSANESDVNNIVNEKGHESRSFYYKLGLLYSFNGGNCVLCPCKPMAYFQFCIALLSILMYNSG